MALRGVWWFDRGSSVIEHRVIEYIPLETPSGLINGLNTVFTLANTPTDSSLVEVYQNGILQLVGGLLDYTIASNTITFVVPPLLGSSLRVSYWFSV